MYRFMRKRYLPVGAGDVYLCAYAGFIPATVQRFTQAHYQYWLAAGNAAFIAAKRARLLNLLALPGYLADVLFCILPTQFRAVIC